MSEGAYCPDCLGAPHHGSCGPQLRDTEMKRLRSILGTDDDIMPKECLACGEKWFGNSCDACGAESWHLLAMHTLVQLQHQGSTVRKSKERIRELEQQVKEMESQCIRQYGGGVLVCGLCEKTYEGPSEEDDEKGPWHEPSCLFYRCDGKEKET